MDYEGRMQTIMSSASETISVLSHQSFFVTLWSDTNFLHTKYIQVH